MAGRDEACQEDPVFLEKIVGKLVAHLRRVSSVTEGEMMAWNAASVTEQDVITWKDSLVASGLHPTTIKNHLTILRTIYNYAAANKHVTSDISAGVKAVKFRAKRSPVLGGSPTPTMRPQ